MKDDASMLRQILAELQEIGRNARAADQAELSAHLDRARSLVVQLHDEQAEQLERSARYRLMLERTVRVTLAEGLRPVASELLDGMMAILGAARGFVGLSQGDSWTFLVARNLQRGNIDDPEAQVSRSIIERALSSGEPVVSHDAPREFAAASVRELALRSVACFPVKSDGHTLGFVYLDDPTTHSLFDQAALDVVRSWLPMVGSFVGRAVASTPKTGLPGVITRSPQLLSDLDELARIAAFDASVLLTGETGTGKSWIARQMHGVSPRATAPFVHVNCGAIPEALVEGELFGAEAGAYTGATRRRIGKFEAAQGGTIFLDELDSMPLSCQVRLLVVLQDRAVTRLGGNRSVPLDVRVIAAMASDPFEAIAAGKLREDLYYRLAVFVTRLPPLRDRPGDVPLLARHILERTRERYQLSTLHLSSTAEQQMLAHSWPGNVRELENALDRAALLSREGAIESLQLGGPSVANARLPTASGGLVPSLQRAATRVVDEMMRQEGLRDLKAVTGFKGAVLLELHQRLGSADAVFGFLNRDRQVESRNHTRVLRREVERLIQLANTVGEEPPAVPGEPRRR